MNNFYKGAALLLLSALGFGLLPIFALYAYKGNISITTLLFIRFLFAAALFFIYAFIKFKRISVGKRDILFLFILGAIGYNLQSQFYFSAVRYIPASLAALLLYTYPMLVTVLSFFADKEKITVKTGVTLCISFIGLVLILGTSVGALNGLGIFFALGAAVVYSIYIVLGNRMVKKLPPIVMSSFIALFSSAGVLTAGLVTNSISFSFDRGVWLPIVGLVLCSTIVAMLFFFRGMELVGATKASIISMMEPVFTVILSTLLLHDRLTVIQLAGGVLVLAGAVLAVWSREQGKTQGIQ